MKKNKGLTLVEMLVVLALLTIAGGFMGSAIITAMRASIRNQMMNEASLIGNAARNYLEEELKFAMSITLDNNMPPGAADNDPDTPDDDAVFSSANPAGIHVISNKDGWLQRKLGPEASDPVQLFGGRHINPGTIINLINVICVDSTAFDPLHPVEVTGTDTADALYMRLEVKKDTTNDGIENGTVFFTDDFMIKNINIINGAAITDSRTAGTLYIHYTKPQ